MAFISAALVPGLIRWSQSIERTEERSRLLSIVTARFKTISWTAIGLLLATGGLNVYHRQGEWSSLTGRLLAVKLGLVLVMLILSGLHDFILGPRLGRLGREAAPGQAGGSLRRIVPWMARINLILAMGVVYLAVLIARS